MNKFFVLPEDNFGDVLYRRIILLVRKNGWGWRSVGAAFGLGGGALSILLGGLLWVVVRFFANGNLGSFLNSVELVFFVIIIPLLALGVHCLDLLEKMPPVLPLPSESRPADSEYTYFLRPRHPHKN